MTFEEILPALKAGQKAVRTVGWGSSEEYIFVVKDDTLNGEKINPYLMIKTKERTIPFTIHADFMRCFSN